MAETKENAFLPPVLFGIIGGILVTVGVFLPWISERGISISGWDGLTRSVSESKDILLVLIGGVLAVTGGLTILAVKARRVDYLILLGGIIALLGGMWFADERILSWSLASYGSIFLVLGVIGGLVSTVFAVKLKKHLIPLGGIFSIFCILLGGILVILRITDLVLVVLVIGGLALTILAAKIKRVYLIPLGGILSIFGIWVTLGGFPGWFFLSYGYYMCLIGSMLCVIGGVGRNLYRREGM